MNEPRINPANLPPELRNLGQRLTVREQILQQIEKGKKAEEALKVLDANPVISEFLLLVGQ